MITDVFAASFPHFYRSRVFSRSLTRAIFHTVLAISLLEVVRVGAFYEANRAAFARLDLLLILELSREPMSLLALSNHLPLPVLGLEPFDLFLLLLGHDVHLTDQRALKLDPLLLLLCQAPLLVDLQLSVAHLLPPLSLLKLLLSSDSRSVLGVDP